MSRLIADEKANRSSADRGLGTKTPDFGNPNRAKREKQTHTVEGITQTTSRPVTHAVLSTNHRGERIMVLTRSPKSAVSDAKRYGDTNIKVHDLAQSKGK